MTEVRKSPSGPLVSVAGGGGFPLMWRSQPGGDGEYMWPWASLASDSGSSPNPLAGAMYAPCDGVIRQATVVGDAHSGPAVSFTLQVESVSSDLVVTLATGELSGTDDDHEVTVERGDKLNVLLGSNMNGDFWNFVALFFPS